MGNNHIVKGGTKGADHIYSRTDGRVDNQVHIYTGAGDDHLMLDLSTTAARHMSHGHHAFGGLGSDTFDLVNLKGLRGNIAGRLDDFSMRSDKLMIEGKAVDLTKAVQFVAGYKVTVVELVNPSSPQMTDPQQWLIVDTGLGRAYYALEGARVLTGSTADEAHFLKWNVTLPNVSRPVVFEDPIDGVTASDYRFDESLMSYGNSSDELFSGGGGADHHHGGRGADTLRAGAGDDFLFGDFGNDELVGGTGNDTLDGGTDDDVLRGDAGNDAIYGGIGLDTIRGGDGADRIYAGSEADLVHGDAGNDHVHAGKGQDTVYGGSGNDVILGMRGRDKLTGDAGDDRIDGGEGADLIAGGVGNDTLQGGNGNDHISGGHGRDYLLGGDGADDFVFRAPSDSTLTAFDTIADFRRGDDIVLSEIDANGALGGDQAFALRSGPAAHAVWVENAPSGQFVRGDVTGDGRADFAIRVISDHSLVADDFIF